jgi:hypothetical protein
LLLYDAGIAYLTSSRVTAADLAARTLTLASGDVITYQKLVIATGADVSKQQRDRFNHPCMECPAWDTLHGAASPQYSSAMNITRHSAAAQQPAAELVALRASPSACTTASVAFTQHSSQTRNLTQSAEVFPTVVRCYGLLHITPNL